MKNIKKIIASAIAGLMAAAALSITAGAAEYYNNDGSYWSDGINDDKVYVEDDYGYYYDLDDLFSYSSYYDYYDSYGYNTLYTETYIGYDAFFGNVYYRGDCGYYSNNGNGVRYLGQSFTFTEYVGKDRCGRKIYYRNEYGYIYFKGNNWYSLGYNINNIAW